MQHYTKECFNSLENNDSDLISFVKKYYCDQIRDIDNKDYIDSKLTIEEMIENIKWDEDTMFPLEEMNALQFLSKKYILPQWLDENFLWKTRYSKKTLDDWWIFEEILELNPDLKTIYCKSDREKKNLLDGVASRFPIDDIKYFIEILDNSCSNETSWNTKLTHRILDNKILCSYLQENEILFNNTIEWYNNALKIWTSHIIYDKFNEFESYEQYIDYIDNTRQKFKDQKIMSESDKIFSDAMMWLDINDVSIFSYFHQRDNLSIINYPVYAFIILRRVVEKKLKRQWEGFWYGLSPDTLVNLIEKYKINFK